MFHFNFLDDSNNILQKQFMHYMWANRIKSPNILLFDVCLCCKTGSRIGSVMVVNDETD